MRQAIFDMLMHAPWGGHALLDGAQVLDGFAGTGAMGLEALSRGAAKVTFIEQDGAAVACLKANIASCRAGDRATIIATDIRRPPRGQAQALVFLDPPYNQVLLPASVKALRDTGWIGSGTIIVSESGRLEESCQHGAILAHRVHGAAQVNVWQEE